MLEILQWVQEIFEWIDKVRPVQFQIQQHHKRLEQVERNEMILFLVWHQIYEIEVDDTRHEQPVRPVQQLQSRCHYLEWEWECIDFVEQEVDLEVVLIMHHIRQIE